MGGAPDGSRSEEASDSLDSSAGLGPDGSEFADVGVMPDAARDDAGAIEPADAAVPSADAGSRPASASCEAAQPWSDPVASPIVGTTTSSRHREQLTCAGSGAVAAAPEAWWRFDLEEPRRVILRLGTAGWSGVLAVRTGTCARDVEMCSDSPGFVEIPAAVGRVSAGVDGFSAGSGPYVLRAQLGPALEIPPSNTTCATAAPLVLPGSHGGHNFLGGAEVVSGCEMASPVYYRFDLASSGMISVRVEPVPALDVEVGVFSGCGAPPIACARAPGRGVTETLGPLSLGPGTHVIAVGARRERPSQGSFELAVSASAECRSDRDCPLGERCSSLLVCAPLSGFTVTSTTRRAIPDGAGALDLPITVPGPSARGERLYARVAIEHPFPEDLVIELWAPFRGSSIPVRLRDRSSSDFDVTYGRDRPADGPGRLDDLLVPETATSTWTLHIEDRAFGDRGFLQGFSLEVE